MITFRDRGARGRHRGALVDAHHSFSFADYNDPKHMGFRTLRVLNEDWIVPGAGFPEHDHDNMEIVSIVLKGTVAHKDSLGNEAVTRAGEFQRMTAGRGISHSEQNLSSDERAHVLQLWIIPSERDLTPSYEHKRFPQLGRNQLVSIASGDGRGESMRIHQDALIEMAWLDEGYQLTKSLSATRGYWVQVISGLIGLNGTEMREGDGAAIEGETKLVIEADTDADVLVLDLP